MRAATLLRNRSGLEVTDDRRLIDLRARRLNDLRPLGRLGGNHRRELLRRAATRDRED